MLCEAAGYDTVLIETVGVGQSEILVNEVCSKPRDEFLARSQTFNSSCARQWRPKTKSKALT